MRNFVFFLFDDLRYDCKAFHRFRAAFGLFLIVVSFADVNAVAVFDNELISVVFVLIHTYGRCCVLHIFLEGFDAFQARFLRRIFAAFVKKLTVVCIKIELIKIAVNAIYAIFSDNAFCCGFCGGDFLNCRFLCRLFRRDFFCRFFRRGFLGCGLFCCCFFTSFAILI